MAQDSKAQATCGFAATVKPFFTDCYRQHMMFMFDLWNPGQVRTELARDL